MHILCTVLSSDSESMTRLESRFLVTGLDSTPVEKNGDSIHRMTRHESQSMTRNSSQSHFYNISEFLIDKPTSYALKEMSSFA